MKVLPRVLLVIFFISCYKNNGNLPTTAYGHLVYLKTNNVAGNLGQDDACNELTITPGKKFLLAVNPGSSIAVFRIADDGSLPVASTVRPQSVITL